MGFSLFVVYCVVFLFVVYCVVFLFGFLLLFFRWFIFCWFGVSICHLVTIVCKVQTIWSVNIYIYICSIGDYNASID